MDALDEDVVSKEAVLDAVREASRRSALRREQGGGVLAWEMERRWGVESPREDAQALSLEDGVL